jgi:hypothetical protein
VKPILRSESTGTDSRDGGNDRALAIEGKSADGSRHSDPAARSERLARVVGQGSDHSFPQAPGSGSAKDARSSLSAAGASRALWKAPRVGHGVDGDPLEGWRVRSISPGSSRLWLALGSLSARLGIAFERH